MKSNPFSSSARRFASGTVARGRVARFTALVSLALASVLRAESRAVIEAAVLFPTPTTLTASLRAEELAACAAEATRVLREQGEDHFAFLDWKQDGAPTTGAVARFNLVFQETPQALGSRYDLVVVGKIGNTTLAGPAPRLVYRATSMEATAGDATKLRDKIIGVIRETFASQDFREELQNGFLRKIPISAEIKPVVEAERILVPLKHQDLQMQADSELMVEFFAREGAARKQVTITLQALEPDPEEPWNLNLKCLVTKFNCDPLRGDAWHEVIPQKWSERIEGTARVMMKHYKRDPWTERSGGLVTALDQ